MREKVIAIVGATNSGKTEYAVKLAKEIDGVIISADSRQVYRGLDIGTNKEGEASSFLGRPSRVINGVHQLLIDVINPGERFTLKDFLDEANKILPDIWANSKTAIIAGGTGLYVTALLEGYQPGQGRHSKLKQPVSFDSKIFMPNIAKEDAFLKSDERIEKIFTALVREVKKLRSDGVSAHWLKEIGLDYLFASEHIDGTLSKEEAIKALQKASRAYIRRQFTWWRHHGEVNVFNVYHELADKVDDFLYL